MGDSTSDRQSWVRDPEAPGEAEPSSSVPSSSSAPPVEYAEMSPASFVQAAYRAQDRYQQENLTGGYAADSYNGMQPSQSLAASTSHVYRDAESSYDTQQSYSDMNTSNEAQIMPDNYMGNSSVASSSMQQPANSGAYAVNHLMVEARRQLVSEARVVSPDVDSTVSQSGGSYDHRQPTGVEVHQQRNVGLLPESTASYVQMANATLSYAQAEVSTSGDSVMRRGHHLHGDNGQGHGEVEILQSHVRSSRRNTDDADGAVSSGSGHNEAEVNVRGLNKVDSRRSLEDMECGEPDTTQGDEEDYIIRGRYESSDEESLDEATPAMSVQERNGAMDQDTVSHNNIVVSHHGAGQHRGSQLVERQSTQNQYVDNQDRRSQYVDGENRADQFADDQNGANQFVDSQNRANHFVESQNRGSQFIDSHNRSNQYVEGQNRAVEYVDSEAVASHSGLIRSVASQSGVMVPQTRVDQSTSAQATASNSHIEPDMGRASVHNNQLLDRNSCRFALASTPQMSAPASMISASNIPVNYAQVPSSNMFGNQILQAEHQNQMMVNEIPLSHISANQMPSSSHHMSMDPVYIFDQVLADSRSRVETQDVSAAQMRSYMEGDLDSTSTDLSLPGPSKPNTSNRVSRRKSSRIADIDNETPVWNKPKFNPSPYDPNHLWCEECMQTYEVQCPIHKLVPVADKIVFSRAWASLPLQLQIFRIGQGETELGVFAKKQIAKQTQFGPFVADLVQSRDLVTRHVFPLMVEQPSGEVTFFETSDENKCNWMMFVRPANNVTDQNLVAYQHGQDIFFTSVKPIEPREELKVWYAAHYADRWNQPVFEATEEDIQAMEEKACKYECYDCPKRFKTAMALQKHLISHEAGGDKGGHNDSGTEPSSSGQVDNETRPHKRKSSPAHASIRKKLFAAKKAKENANSTMESVGSSPGIYHWKKRSTNIYLNKTLKKYQKRHDVEVMRKSIQLQHSQNQQAVSKSTDITCYECELVFENFTLYNLHFFTHATDDERQRADLSEFQRQVETYQANGVGGATSSETTVYVCPACPQQFYQKGLLIEHVRYHSKNHLAKMGQVRPVREVKFDPKKPNKCEKCNKGFTTPERLQNHIMCHEMEDAKPFQCNVCLKRFMNNSAMACHLKTHSDSKYYQCPICDMGFDHTVAMREHSFIHANPNGTFNCPHCEKVFVEFLVLKKHMRGFHTNKSFPCPSCDKIFPRMDKLRLHMLRHSSVKEFMCDTCGRQFKRKDKLKEHIKRMHSLEREEKDRQRAMKPPTKRFIPKVSPTEYHRFIYKCHLCMLGFKRRGMLVNHIAKRHPDIKPESVPELNLPILKTQRDYYCQYCDKVYKSSSKRKSHILKNHPGSELPQSARKKTGIDEIPGIPNPTYSQTVGSVTTMPHQCEYCHKQYASKAKLLQHQRKKHPESVASIRTVPVIPQRPPPGAKLLANIQHIPTGVALQPEEALTVVEQYDGEGQTTDAAQATDLLTQAMSELTQSVEFRQISATQGPDGAGAFLTARLSQGLQGAPAMVQIQTTGAQGTSTIELAHLSQALSQFAPPQGHLPIQVQVSTAGPNHIQIPILTSHAGASGSGTQILTVDPLQDPDSPQQPGTSQAQPQQITFSPISIVGGTYIPKSWTNYTYKSH